MLVRHTWRAGVSRISLYLLFISSLKNANKESSVVRNLRPWGFIWYGLGDKHKQATATVCRSLISMLHRPPQECSETQLCSIPPTTFFCSFLEIIFFRLFFAFVSLILNIYLLSHCIRLALVESFHQISRVISRLSVFTRPLPHNRRKEQNAIWAFAFFFRFGFISCGPFLDAINFVQPYKEKQKDSTRNVRSNRLLKYKIWSLKKAAFFGGSANLLYLLCAHNGHLKAD